MCVSPLVLVVVVLCSAPRGALGQDTGFMFKGMEVPGHSQVAREEIGTDNADSLMCVSNYSSCCTNSENTWWFPGSGTPGTDTRSGYYQSRDDGVVRLHNGGSAAGEGIFYCDIRVADGASGIQTLLVGIYPSVSDGDGDGTPTVDCTGGTFTLDSGPEADTPNFTLTGCTSTGGAVREFSCTSPGGGTGTTDGTNSFTNTATDRQEGNYAFSVSVTGYYPGEYTCQATVYRYNGTDPEPQVINYPAALTITAPAALPPTGLTAPQAGTTMRLYWTPPSPTPYGYRIYYQLEGPVGAQQSVIVVGGSTTSHDLTVQEDVEYTVSIQTLSETMLPSVVSATVQSRTVPFFELSDPTLMQLNTTTFRVSWEPPDSSTEIPVTGYRVFYTVDGATMSETLESSELQWLLTLDEDQSHNITIALQSLFDSFPSSLVSVEVPEIPSGPVSDLAGSVSLFQVNVIWSEIPVDSATGVITRYEINYTSSDSSTEVTEYTDSAELMISNSSRGTSYRFSVTPFSLFARGNTEQGTYQTLTQPPPVEGVNVEAFGAKSVEVSWDPVPLPLEELEAYRVYYREVAFGKKRQAVCECEGSENFPADVSSGLIDGLTTGARYQFQVTVVAMDLDGSELEGERSVVDENSIVMPEVHVQDDSEDCDYTNELVGAVVGTFFATILVYTVILVTVIAVPRAVRGRKRDYSVKGQDPQSLTDIPLKSCLAYGEVKQQSGGEEGGGKGEVHIYEPTDQAVGLAGGGDDGIYEN